MLDFGHELHLLNFWHENGWDEVTLPLLWVYRLKMVAGATSHVYISPSLKGYPDSMSLSLCLLPLM